MICQTPLYSYRVFNSLTLEVVLASAFGRSIDIQRGKADELTEVVKGYVSLFQEGQQLSVAMLTILYSMSKNIHGIIICAITTNVYDAS